MNANPVFRRLAEIEAVENNVTYEDIVSAQVGTNPWFVLFHYDWRTAWREYRRNVRAARSVARQGEDTPATGAPPF